MQNEQVLSILDSLAAGVDPNTGAAIPHDLFHTPDVIRALYTAANLLRQPAANRPAAAGARWTDEEDAALCREFDGAMSVADIARQHGRTSGAITSRLVKLGRIDPDSVKVRDRGARWAS